VLRELHHKERQEILDRQVDKEPKELKVDKVLKGLRDQQELKVI
jgi:hypothetical protein